MEIKTERYRVSYDPPTSLIVFRGSLRLRGMAEYAPIIEILEGAVQDGPQTITVDLRGLEFLNSSGINMLLRFVIDVRERGQSQVAVKGTKRVAWQQKSLKNLQKLLPALRLDWEQDPTTASG